MRKFLDQLITSANLVILISLSNLIYEKHLQLENQAEIYFFILFLFVLLNFYTVVKWNRFLSAILISCEILFCFFLSEYIYLGHSYHFWFWSVLIWTSLGMLKKNITFDDQLKSVQFFILSLYTCAGFGKIFGIFRSKDSVFSGVGLISSLLTDVYLKLPPFIVKLVAENIAVTNFFIAMAMILQISAVFLFFVFPRKYLGLPFIFFHMMNIFILGTSFAEAVLTLIVFFLVPYFDIKEEPN